jgi:hypothetical protein
MRSSRFVVGAGKSCVNVCLLVVEVCCACLSFWETEVRGLLCLLAWVWISCMSFCYVVR